MYVFISFLWLQNISLLDTYFHMEWMKQGFYFHPGWNVQRSAWLVFAGVFWVFSLTLMGSLWVCVIDLNRGLIEPLSWRVLLNRSRTLNMNRFAEMNSCRGAEGGRASRAELMQPWWKGTLNYWLITVKSEKIWGVQLVSWDEWNTGTCPS